MDYDLLDIWAMHENHLAYKELDKVNEAKILYLS